MGLLIHYHPQSVPKSLRLEHKPRKKYFEKGN